MSSATVFSRRHAAALAILGMLALVAAFSWHSTASASPPAYPPSNSCVVSISVPVTAGTTTTLVGSGFAPNETVALTLLPNTSLGSVSTTSTGTFSQQITIPAAITGSNTIQASAPSSTCSFGPFSVGSATGGGSGVEGVSAGTQGVSAGTQGVSAGTQGVTSGIAGVTATRGLASTGFATLTASAIGLALLAGGAMFLIVGRRRKA